MLKKVLDQVRLSEDKTLNQHGYKLTKKIGEGSFACVYLVECINTNPDSPPRSLACKIVDIAKASKDMTRKFLPRELNILVRLHHPHIIHIHSIFQRKTKYFIFMRNAENGDLLEYILKKGPVSEMQSRIWMRQLCLAVEYLHEMEVAHRDLKCENCLITSNYNLKLSDFGFARFVIDADGKTVTSSTYCGSLAYAAPEVLRGIPYFPKIADMWSIGAILFVMINKSLPFEETNIKRLYEEQLKKNFKFRSKIVRLVSGKLLNVVQQLLEPDITKRWKVSEILNSDWMKMDHRLEKLSEAEEDALVQAAQERNKFLDEHTVVSTIALERRTISHVQMLKSIDMGAYPTQSYIKSGFVSTMIE